MYGRQNPFCHSRFLRQFCCCVSCMKNDQCERARVGIVGERGGGLSPQCVWSAFDWEKDNLSQQSLLLLLSRSIVTCFPCHFAFPDVHQNMQMWWLQSMHQGEPSQRCQNPTKLRQIFQIILKSELTFEFQFNLQLCWRWTCSGEKIWIL